MGIDRLAVLKAYLDTRRAPVRSRADIEQRQAKLWREFAPVVARTPALAAHAGKPLDQFPVVTPADLRDRFDQWNTLGITREAAHAAAADAERGGSGEVAPGVSAGFSTGTSGTRGVFLASAQERARYLGQALAKLLPWDGLFRPRRIALCLRADSALYRDVSNAGPFRFRFIGLATPLPKISAELATFAPHILIAPSHILAGLARMTTKGDVPPPRLQRLFYGAEPMGDEERSWIDQTLGARPDPIYQATEGFLGASCRHGNLHLNEDSLIIERMPVPGTNRFQPIVTDLRRTTQPMVRVLLDDLLEPLNEPVREPVSGDVREQVRGPVREAVRAPLREACVCGSAHAAVRGVEGRVRDLWRWGAVAVTPRDVETAVAGALGADAEWRAVGAPDGVVVEAAGADVRAAEAVRAMLAQLGASVHVQAAVLREMEGPKRQRVRWVA
jgi:putative adenylate-forming enzyme